MKRSLLLIALVLAVPACTVDVTDVLDVPANIDEIRTYFNGNNALVYTRDAQNTTGAAAIVSLDAPFSVLKKGISEGGWFSNDVMLQGDSRYVYIIDRTNGNVTVIDPVDGAAELKQISVGPTSNPKSVVRIGGKLYITRWNETSVLVLDATTFAETGTVDLSEFADGDGTPEMGLAVTAEGRVWVALERYDQLNYWAPSTLPVDGAYLVSIDPATDRIEKRVKLTGTTPYQMLKVDPLSGDLLLISSQNYAAGIEAVDPKTGTAKGWLVEPATFADGIFFAEATTTHVYVVSGEGAHNGAPDWDWDYAVLWAIDRATGVKTEVYRTADGYMGLACLELSPGTTRAPNKRLIVTCAGPGARVTRPGLHIFDPVSLKELTKAPLDTGLPPFGVAFFARPETEVVSVPATSATLP
jgi:hypothetical protein